MSIFDLRKVEAIRARELVYELVVNQESVLDLFEKKLVGTTYATEYASILKYIEYAANGNSLPATKMRMYGRRGLGEVSEFEFKSKHLRVWAIQQPFGKIIVLGGFKNSQDKDQRKFWELKQQYLTALKQQK